MAGMVYNTWTVNSDKEHSQHLKDLLLVKFMLLHKISEKSSVSSLVVTMLEYSTEVSIQEFQEDSHTFLQQQYLHCITTGRTKVLNYLRTCHFQIGTK